MVDTNLAELVGDLLKERKLKRKDICKAFDIAPSNLSRLLHKGMPTPQLVDIVEWLGYDLVIEIIPRDDFVDE